MTYGTFIDQLRIQSGDLKKTAGATWTADGSTKVLLLPVLSYPVLAASYTMKKNGVNLTETTDFTIDLETGRIDIVSLPANGDIFEFVGTRVSLTDNAWIGIINDVIRAMSEAFFKEVTDSVTFTTTAHMRSLALADFIAVFDIGYYPTGNTDLVNAQNWRFSPDEEKAYFGDYDEFQATGNVVKVRGLKKYTLGALISDTLDMQDRFLGVLKLGCIAQYWRYKIRENVENLAKITQDTTRTGIQELIMLADRYDRWFQIDWQKLSPPRPSHRIPIFNPRKGRP